MLKTSPELLVDILGVLGHISTKLDTISSKPDKKGPGLGVGVVLGSLLKGKRSGEGIGAMADSVKKLNKELDHVNTRKLSTLIKQMSSYHKLEVEQSKLKGERRTGMAAAAKDMGLALLYTAGGIAALVGTFYYAKEKLGMPVWEVLGLVVLTAATLALSMMIISAGDAAGEKLSGGLLSKATTLKGFKGAKADKGRNKSAIHNAKDMGIALMFIAGGLLAFAGTLILVPLMLGLGPKPLLGMGIVAAVIIGLTGLIALLGFANRFIQPGIAAGKGIGKVLAFMSLGILAVALTSKLLMSMGDPEAKNKKGEKRGKFGQLMAGIGPGLGMFGLFILAVVGLFWAVGFPVVSGPMILGAIALIMMSISLLLLCTTAKKIVKSVDELGGKKGIDNLTQNIRLLVGGVMGAVIDGVMGNLDKPSKRGESPDGNLSLRELRQFRRVTKAVKMLGHIARSISMFARGLRAFAKLGEISSLEYEIVKDPLTGEELMKPKIGGDKIHVVEIAKSLTDTFGMFIKSLVENTQGLTRRQARALKILGKALSGERGIISGVVQFSTALKTFSEFGSKGEIYVPAVLDENGKIVKEAENVPIRTVTQHIVDTFGQFVEAMAAKAPLFELGGVLGTKMARFSEALMGKQRSWAGKIFARDKPGILSAITSFNDVLLTYSEYGKGGKIPKKDKEGNIIPKQYILVEDIANNMVDGITTFVNSLNKALKGKNLEASSKAIEKQISSFTSIITQFDILAKSQEGMEKLANSMGLLATNVGLLVTNMGGLNTDNLQKLATVTAQHAVTTKGVEIKPTSGTPTAVTTGGTDWNNVAEMIATKIAQKLVGSRNGEFNFTFYDGNTGGKLEIKEK